jgi:flavin-dependent dehydrogenase
METQTFDIAIVGGGIAGSVCAILLAQSGKKVVLFEKDDLPKHRVCGEFISLETYQFFQDLGLNLDTFDLPIIRELLLTEPSGTELKSSLNMGGFGISRYLLDFELMMLAKKSGVHFLTQTKVVKIENNQIRTQKGIYHAKQIIAAHGKNSANYILHQPKNQSQKNYIGVKYHMKGNFDANQIALHDFDGGYCGMSKIENETFCLCYLADSKILKSFNGNIKEMEKHILMANKYLKEIFSKAEFIWDKPLTISNISLEPKSVFKEGILFIGDAAGGISPLSGNGMSIAAASADILAKIILENNSTSKIVNLYEKSWNQHFANKTKWVKNLNSVLIHPEKFKYVLKILRTFPKLHQKITSYVQEGYFSK